MTEKQKEEDNKSRPTVPHMPDADLRFYKDKGYLVARALFSPDEIAEIRRDTAKIFGGGYGFVDGLLPVSGNESDEDVLRNYVAIHFPHKISPVINRYLSHPAVTNILQNIISPNVKCMQSMLFVKGPGKAGQSWHQDEYFIPTRDKSLTGVWIAVDDATVENGCLWVVPGSHQPGYIMPRVANSSNEYADEDTIDVSGYSQEEIVPLEAKKGDVVFFNGYLLHSSLRNKTTGHFRTALVNHYMSAESMLPWDQDGKFPLTEDLRDIVMVAGNDPYAHKPIVNMNLPYLRPEVLKAKATM